MLEAAGAHFGFKFDWHWFDWSCETYLASGKMMPPMALSNFEDSTPYISVQSDALTFRTIFHFGVC